MRSLASSRVVSPAPRSCDPSANEILRDGLSVQAPADGGLLRRLAARWRHRSGRLPLRSRRCRCRGPTSGGFVSWTPTSVELRSPSFFFFFFGQRLRFWFRFRWLRLVAAKAHRTNAVARIFFSSNCARGGSVMDVWPDFLNEYSAPLFELIARELLNFSRKFPPALLEHRCTDRIPTRTT